VACHENDAVRLCSVCHQHLERQEQDGIFETYRALNNFLDLLHLKAGV
jgi:hypothetical protein